MPSNFPGYTRGGIIHEGALYRGYRYSLPPDLARSYANEHAAYIRNHPRRPPGVPPRLPPGAGTARTKWDFLPLDGL